MPNSVKIKERLKGCNETKYGTSKWAADINKILISLDESKLKKRRKLLGA
jgi:hypothetical protein